MMTLVDAIRERLRFLAVPTTEAAGQPFTVFPPVSAAQVCDAEAALGFPLPALLRDIYVKIGNGGFGPGCGLFGLQSGDYRRWNAVQLYHSFRHPPTSHERRGGKALPPSPPGWGFFFSFFFACSPPP